ncbi:uncharacterized protein VTP21DRAFT_318 [Calcarisporiella thermophila]|uniref:uncharacterized protein n=1 Tax=Calcarisporiella thermophila TaxID=911321 RepID=UPI00374464CB
MYRQTRKRHALTTTRLGDVALHTAPYPYRLNFYLDPPLSEVTLEEFELFALDRVKVLKIIETYCVRGKNDEEMKRQMEEACAQHLPLHSNNAKHYPLQEERRKDHISHFILRLAYARTEDLRRWFINNECELFRYRFESETLQDRYSYLTSLNLSWKMISKEEKDSIRKELMASSPHIAERFESEAFFEVDWQKALDLVHQRRIFLKRGKAYVPSSDLIVLVLGEFRKHLTCAMEAASKALPRLDEDDRLVPVLNNINTQSSGKEFTASVPIAGKVSANDVPNLEHHFPLCMRHLYSQLTKDKHMKHGGRMQFGLFLKGVGLSLEESMIFWQKAFTKISSDDFHKKGYAYNIRHNYGMEGKRTNYTPYSCTKIIMGDQPHAGEHHGCPFRHFSPENLTATLRGYKVPESGIREILELVQGRHYQVACTRYYELTRRPKEEGASTKLLEPVEHPNIFFNKSYELETGLEANK